MIIYVELFDEGTPVWRPVEAEQVYGDVYRIGPDPIPDEEQWAFHPGDLVRVEQRDLNNGKTSLVVVGQAREE